MKTNDMIRWCDYARGLVARTSARKMERELAQDATAYRLVNVFKRVARVGEADTCQRIPPHALRVARAAGSIHRVEEASAGLGCRAFSVLFDSLTDAAVAGTRELHPTHRQFLYQAEPYTVELRMEKESSPRHQLVIGQLLRHEEATEPMADIPVMVLAEGEVVGRDITSRFGEFQACGLPAGPLQLRMLVPSSSYIELPIGNL